MAGRPPPVADDADRGSGYAYLHTAIDDHSRLASAEVLPDEQGRTTAPSGGVPTRGSGPAASPSSGS